MFPGLTNLKNPGNPPTNSLNGPAKGMLPGLDSGNLTQVGNIATQNLGGNSLTQMLRSLQNYQATQGQRTFEHGQDITDTGIQGFGTAADSSNEAMGTTRSALATLSPAEDYWTKLLSGDQQTTMKAIAPTALQAGTNYANATSNVNQNMARGGYAGVLGASLPQTQAREVNTELYKLQPAAATNLNTIAGTKQGIAGTQGNISGIQGQIANWLSSLGIDVSKLGQGFLQMASNSLLGGRGQDVTEHGQAMDMATTLSNTLLHDIDQATMESAKTKG